MVWPTWFLLVQEGNSMQYTGLLSQGRKTEKQDLTFLSYMRNRNFERGGGKNPLIFLF